MIKFLKVVFHRMTFVGIAILLQLALIFILVLQFQQFVVYFYQLCLVFSVITVIYIVNDKSNPGYKIAWIIPILLVPIFGWIIYLIFGRNKLDKRTRIKMDRVAEKTKDILPDNEELIERIEEENINAANQSRYIKNYGSGPVYKNTFAEFIETGEKTFEYLLEEIKKAEQYIFLEYFIIEEGIMWNSILEVLKEKAQNGVDVRLIYDDMGSLFTLPYNYNKILENMGIKCRVYNPFIPVASSRLNNRDHRKIVVVDGRVGFTGGVNLADEYINAYEKHGHWKDSSIMVKGEAVWNFTVMFLTLWEFLAGSDEDYSKFKYEAQSEDPDEYDGYIQPYTDFPHDDEPVGELIYMNLINKAHRYVYITTPYLIIDNEMVTSLIAAAKSGIDVRIITPHIADKWFVHAVTRAYYETLLESGVRIYEYTPGFIHSKTFCADDIYATVGTINMDYRSLYMHNECGVWMYNTGSVMSVKDDFMKTLEVCEEITFEDAKNVKWFIKLGRGLLRIFAPLL